MNLKFENMNFDYIIPIGEECYTSQSIDKKFNIDIRKKSFPFDYVAGTHLDFLINIFNDILNKTFDYKLEDLQIVEFPYEKKKYTIKDKYELYYIHDAFFNDIGEISVDIINNVFEKYNNRYKRLLSVLNSESYILFYSVQHFNYIYNNYDITNKNNVYDRRINLIYKLQDILLKINKNIKILCINFDNKSFNDENIMHINLKYNMTNDKSESKSSFYDKLYEFSNNFFTKITIN